MMVTSAHSEWLCKQWHMVLILKHFLSWTRIWWLYKLRKSDFVSMTCSTQTTSINLTCILNIIFWLKCYHLHSHLSWAYVTVIFKSVNFISLNSGRGMWEWNRSVGSNEAPFGRIWSKLQAGMKWKWGQQWSRVWEGMKHIGGRMNNMLEWNDRIGRNEAKDWIEWNEIQAGMKDMWEWSRSAGDNEAQFGRKWGTLQAGMKDG